MKMVYSKKIVHPENHQSINMSNSYYMTYFFQILRRQNILTSKCKFMKCVNNSNLFNGPVPK